MSLSEITFRRAVCALALPAFPLALLVTELVSPTESIENADQLRAAAAHGGSWQAAALIELLAAVLLPLAAAGVVQAVRGRGSTLAGVGGVLGVLGTLGMTLIGARHLFIYGLTAADTTSALHALDRMDNGAGAIALPLMIAAPATWVVLSVAAFRAGLASGWIIAGTVVFAVVDMLPIPGAEVVQSLVGIVTFGALAARTLRSGAGAAARGEAQLEVAATSA